MTRMPDPPKSYMRFTRRYPKLNAAWEAIREEGDNGPLDERMQRLIRFAIAVGAVHEAAINVSVRKGLAVGIGREEMEQVVALAAGTLGMQSTAAVYSWVCKAFDEAEEEKG